jgi:tetratricopeptide (TPR) repeat protein
MGSFRSSSVPRVRRRACRPLLGVAVSLLATGTAFGQDFNRANDYYAVQGMDRVKVVEQYHLGPCEKALRARDYPRALGECDFILKIFPNHPQALLLTTQICMQWKESRCSLEDLFAQATSINPKAPGTFVIQGIYLHRAGQYGKAIDSYNYALGLESNLLNAHYNLALTYIETKQYDLANTHAQRAYSLGATLPGLRNRLTKLGYWKPEQGASDKPAGTPSVAGTK